MGQGVVGNKGRTTRGYLLDDEPGDKHELSRERESKGGRGMGMGRDWTAGLLGQVRHAFA